MSRHGTLDFSQRSSLNLATSCFPPFRTRWLFYQEDRLTGGADLFRCLRHMTARAKARRFRPQYSHQSGQHLRKGPDILRRL